jgi:hypothetical protein
MYAAQDLKMPKDTYYLKMSKDPYYGRKRDLRKI